MNFFLPQIRALSIIIEMLIRVLVAVVRSALFRNDVRPRCGQRRGYGYGNHHCGARAVPEAEDLANRRPSLLPGIRNRHGLRNAG